VSHLSATGASPILGTCAVNRADSACCADLGCLLLAAVQSVMAYTTCATVWARTNLRLQRVKFAAQIKRWSRLWRGHRERRGGGAAARSLSAARRRTKRQVPWEIHCSFGPPRERSQYTGRYSSRLRRSRRCDLSRSTGRCFERTKVWSGMSYLFHN